MFQLQLQPLQLLLWRLRAQHELGRVRAGAGLGAAARLRGVQAGAGPGLRLGLRTQQLQLRPQQVDSVDSV